MRFKIGDKVKFQTCNKRQSICRICGPNSCNGKHSDLIGKDDFTIGKVAKPMGDACCVILANDRAVYIDNEVLYKHDNFDHYKQRLLSHGT